MSANRYLKLNSGYKMPIIGMGTWQTTSRQIDSAIDDALEAGYRHFDTAPVYANEEAIGRILKRWVYSGRVEREDLFIVTKLPPTANRPEDVEKTFLASLENLQLDYVDMYLIHTPIALLTTEDGNVKIDNEGFVVPDMTTNLAAIWEEMEKLVYYGLAKSIGVSNFDQEQVQRLLKSCKIRPATNQIEHHVYLQQKELIDYCKSEDIVVTAFGPLGSKHFDIYNAQAGLERELPNLMDISEVKDIARAHGKTPAQVLLRFIIESGIAAIPKSINPEHIEQNIDVFDFKLTTEDRAKLSSLDQDFRVCDFALLPGAERHPEFRFKNQYTE